MIPTEQLVPPPTKAHVSVARLARHWYVACRSKDLGEKKPLARTVLGIPLALFRDGDGRAAALLDRCPHRNVPLSLGHRDAATGNLTCRYHGWQFDRTGRCRAVPGLDESAAPGRERACPRAAVREQEGLVWVYGALDEEPTSEPFRLGLAELADHTLVTRELEADATLHAVLENALDVPHTAFLHRGLFRGGERHEIRARVRRSPQGVEAEYLGEPRPSGLVGRLLSPSGGTVEHWDRFLLPSIGQVEYRIGTESHFVVTALCTPISDFRTRLTAVAAFKTRLPDKLLRALLEPVALMIFAQDARILRAQTANIRRFGGEQYMSTELDLLGGHIWRALKQAERGETLETSVESEVRLFA